MASHEQESLGIIEKAGIVAVLKAVCPSLGTSSVK